ncbi:hypothetical protein GCM10023153_34100 [Ornithinibacter aureus]|uniref:Uncharacterized protein n=1 Tax=Ornithinibacter aureus TaxID=622664 RepID=A0ABP8KCR8_9MICO
MEPRDILSINEPGATQAATAQITRPEQLPDTGIVETQTARRFLDVDLHQPPHFVNHTAIGMVHETLVRRSIR